MTQDPRPSWRVWRRVMRALAVLVTLSFAVQGLAIASARAPVHGDFFEFDYATFLDQGQGDFAGYSEEERGHYRYSVTASAPGEATVRFQGSWAWSASDGNRETGGNDSSFTFDVATRRYLIGTDVYGYVDPAVWFWVQTPLARGQPVQILDDWLGVVELDATIWIGVVPKKALLLETAGTYSRDDVYGQFYVAYHDRYYFDKETGYVIAELYEETDSGAYASFRWRFEAFVSASSYAIPIDVAAFSALDLGLPALGVAGVVLAVRRWRGPWTVHGGPAVGGKVVVRRARSLKHVQGLSPEASRSFSWFLPLFARRAILSGDPVLVARQGSRMVGLFTFDGESGLGSLFAADEGIARFLLKKLKAEDFFVEANGTSWNLPAQAVDAFDVLELRDPQPMTFDAGIVRPMTVSDLGAVTSIAEEVYKGRARRWVATSFQDGDLAFVATVQGQVVGFAFATVAAQEARLHSLTVLPRFRAQGLGTELMSARLTALAALGIRRAVVEVSQHNAASLRVSYRAGFQAVGKSVHYTRRTEMSVLAFQRQF